MPGTINFYTLLMLTSNYIKTILYFVGTSNTVLTQTKTYDK